MARLQREYLAKRIAQNYVNIADRQKQITANHFFARVNTMSKYIW